ncbi:MAG: transferrin-binding protein-like solute binding protein [Nitrospira sp. SB0677_bin_15]|nr:transferrin-binding protein-like solute binding protein [Nitrospira sp. SB0677_bin_15]MYH01475.1 transferrin-binding protein-like solute binding protein [Nitrospira sp. SB0675_bin_23]
MMKHFHLGTITLSIGLLLSACGGGGGGSMNGMMETGDTPSDPQPPPSEMQTAEMQTAFSGTQTRNVSDLTYASATQVATQSLNASQQPSTPIFGSVVQAFTSPRLSDVTGIETTFNGSRFTLQINRQDGSSTTLDTDHDDVLDVEEISPSENQVTNRNAAEGYVYRLNESPLTLTAAGVSVEWASTDFTDYLSGGYWVHVDINAQHAEIGAFIDGPEFERTIQVPVTGTATYTGRAGGVYVSRYGTDFPGVPSGTLEQGEYTGRARLTADFESSRISGRIDNIGLYHVSTMEPDGTIDYYPSLQNTDYEGILGAAPINQTGTFEGQGVTLTHPQVQITSSGSWAGRFSISDNAAGNPRAVAGTHRASFTTAGDSTGIFVGAFYGATERFE